MYRILTAIRDLFSLPTEEEIMSAYHQCPIDSCQVEVAARRLMCVRHWAMVPGPLGTAVYAAWKQGRGAGTEEHIAAMQAAIDAVHEKLGEAAS